MENALFSYFLNAEVIDERDKHNLSLSYLNKILTLQKRVLLFMYFANKNERTIPLSINQC